LAAICGAVDLIAEQVADLVVIDQRQAGQAQQQHEDGADQAAPFMDPRPAADGYGCHFDIKFGNWNPNDNNGSHLNSKTPAPL
jgi:hypothetical protein